MIKFTKGESTKVCDVQFKAQLEKEGWVAEEPKKKAKEEKADK